MRVLRTVICGSYHRDPTGLQKLYTELALAGCQVLSPFGVVFEDNAAEFVTTGLEDRLTPQELERRHLTALAHADFIWLHAPDGYVGMSGAFELGFAVASRKPIFTKHTPNEKVLQQFTSTFPSVFDALSLNGLLES